MTVTSLVHEVMPLVRYCTGDLVRVAAEPCGCGHAGPAAEVLGRFDDLIEIGGGRTTHYEVLDAVYDFRRCGSARASSSFSSARAPCTC